MFGVLIGVAAAAVTYLVEDKVDEKIQERRLTRKIIDTISSAFETGEED